jgi:hypothetical protein
MKASRKSIITSSLSGIVVLVAIFASKDEIYFALSREQMFDILNEKHLNKLLKAPTNGTDQESLIGQIKLLKSGRWKQFSSVEQTKLLEQKLIYLNAGLERRKLLSEISQEEKAAVSIATALKQLQLANKGKMNATVTRYLLDAPPIITEGEATYNEMERYIEFFNENNGGHRYNHRCYHIGTVLESDSIITKSSWMDERDYTCSIDVAPSGLPIAVAVRSLSNNGFVVLRGRFSSRRSQTQLANKQEHCPKTIKEKQLIVEQLIAEKITAAEGRRKIASIKAKADQCY